MKFKVLIIIALLLSNCVDRKENENCHKHVTIINESNKAIYFIASGRLYPDTLTLYPDPTNNQYYKIEAYSNQNDIYRDCIEYHFNVDSIEMYFIFDAHLLETTSWETVVNNYMILKRYDLTLEDLQRSDWTITYP
jgi:hypothetical protein